MEYPAAHTEAGSLAAGPGPINAIKQLKHTAKKISTSLSKRVVVLAFEKSAVLPRICRVAEQHR